MFGKFFASLSWINRIFFKLLYLGGRFMRVPSKMGGDGNPAGDGTAKWAITRRDGK